MSLSDWLALAVRRIRGFARIQVIGPLLLATMLWAVSISIKAVAFQSTTWVFELAPQMAVWSVGILFTRAVTDRTYFGGQLVYRVMRDQQGRGLRVQYDVSVPDHIEMGPRHLYMFMYAVTVWILTILFAGDATRRFVASVTIDWVAHAVNIGCLFLAATAIGLAMATLREAAR